MKERNTDQSELYPAEKARQGRIILDTKGKRAAFFFGLAGIVVFGLLLAFLA